MQRESTAVPSSTELEQLTRLAHRANWIATGELANCISASAALAHVLRHLGYEDAEPVRVTTGIYPHDRSLGCCVLGSDGDGSPRPPASPGGWYGHLVVRAAGHLLDPTLDQARENNPHLKVGPLTLPIPAGWDDDVGWGPCTQIIYTYEHAAIEVRYTKREPQTGWKSKPAFRRSQWGDIADELLRQLEAPR